MHILVLGTAAGGGFPQWNCWCPGCRTARERPAAAHPRTQSSIAVSADGRRWFLCDASPDVREQLARLPLGSSPLPPAVARHNPVEGIVLTDAELDHTLGVVLLREGRELKVYATEAVLRTIEHDSRILPVTRAFARVDTTTLPLERATPLRHRDGTASGIEVLAFPVAGDAPRFASEERAGHTVGLVIRDAGTGGSCAFVPGCGGLDEALLARLAATDVVLLDGTFWDDEEPVRLGIGDRTATAMGHAPISGAAGTLARLAALPARHKVYTHLNNTNPVLLEGSAERGAVEGAGVEVGEDGMQFEV